VPLVRGLRPLYARSRYLSASVDQPQGEGFSPRRAGSPESARAASSGRKRCHAAGSSPLPTCGRLLADPSALAAVHRKHHARNELRLVGGEEKSGVCDVPCGPHLRAERYLRVSLADQLLPLHAT